MYKNKSSFTLVEVLVAFFILSVAIVGAMGVYTQMQGHTLSSNSMTVATRDLGAIMETLRTLTMTEIRDLRDDDDYWSDILSGQLSNEDISLVETSGDWNSNPLKIRATLSWTEGARQRTLSMFSVFSDD